MQFHKNLNLLNSYLIKKLFIYYLPPKIFSRLGVYVFGNYVGFSGVDGIG